MSNLTSRPNQLPLIGIPVDVKHLDGRAFHSVGEKYIRAVAQGAQAFPLLIPSKITEENHSNIVSMITMFDGIFLPGSHSMVHPERYGQTAEYSDMLLDEQRDESTIDLIHLTVAHEIPLLAVCRGFQEMNVALGGSLHQQVHKQSDYFDHREDKEQPPERQYDLAHEVSISTGGILSNISDKVMCEVNSLHTQGVDRLGKGLKVEATSTDGLIEAFSIEEATAFSLGVQWHPEAHFVNDPLSNGIFKAFGDASRKKQQQRLNAQGFI